MQTVKWEDLSPAVGPGTCLPAIANKFNVVKGCLDASSTQLTNLSNYATNLGTNLHAVSNTVTAHHKHETAQHQALTKTVNANHEALTNKVNANHQASTENHQALTKKVNANHQASTKNHQALTITVKANHQVSTANHQALTNTVNENHQDLTNVLNQEREKTQESLKKTDEDFKACEKKIQLQAGRITGIQQRVVDASGRIANLEVKAQQEKAERDAVENRVKDIEGQVRGFNQIQADLTETKIRLALIEQQNAILFKSLEADKKQLDALKQKVLLNDREVKQFERTIEENKQESKAKHAKAADEINHLRERIDKGDKAIKSKADAVEISEQEEDPILRAINQEKDNAESSELKQEEGKLAALMASGGPQGDIKKIEWQSQALARLEERNKLKMESLTHQMLALEQNMQQLEKREEALKKMDKKDHGRTALNMAQLREQIQESNVKKFKRQSSMVDLKPNKKKTKSSLEDLDSNKKKD